MDDKNLIRSMTKGVYDIQQLRVQMGNRLVANFKVKLGIEPSTKEEDAEKDKQKILSVVRVAYKRITDGVNQISRRTNFDYDGVISDYSELCLVDLYMSTLRDEESHMKRLAQMVEKCPLWDAFLKDVKGIGGTLSAVIISEIDIHKAKYVSSIWKYAGLDVVDGEGRSRKSHHLEESEYENKDGDVKTKKGITFNPFLKTKLIGVAGTSFLRASGGYKDIYDGYKNRLQNMEAHVEKSKGHIHNMAVRYMVKMFLKDLYVAWKQLEGLEVHPTYQEAKLNHVHGS